VPPPVLRIRAFTATQLPRLGASPLAEDVEFKVTIPEGTPISGEVRGKQAVTEHFEQLGDLLEFRQERPMEFFGSGDRVVVLGRESFEIKKNGATVSGSEYADVLDFRDGLITHFLVIQDLTVSSTPTGTGSNPRMGSLDDSVAPMAAGQFRVHLRARGEKDLILDDSAVDVCVRANQHMIAEDSGMILASAYECVLHDDAQRAPTWREPPSAVRTAPRSTRLSSPTVAFPQGTAVGATYAESATAADDGVLEKDPSRHDRRRRPRDLLSGGGPARCSGRALTSRVSVLVIPVSSLHAAARRPVAADRPRHCPASATARRRILRISPTRSRATGSSSSDSSSGSASRATRSTCTTTARSSASGSQWRRRRGCRADHSERRHLRGRAWPEVRVAEALLGEPDARRTRTDGLKRERASNSQTRPVRAPAGLTRPEAASRWRGDVNVCVMA
jgi:ketosteroid isomerase-like protein